MATVNEIKKACVTGFVKKPRDNKDGSLTFRIGKKGEGRTFTLSASNKHAIMLLGAKRALVQYEVSGSKNPKVLVVVSEPSGRTTHHFNRESV